MKKTIRLNRLQEHLWMDQLIKSGSPVHNLGARLDIYNKVNIELFRKAVNLVIKENDVLRTRFTWDGIKVYQDFDNIFEYNAEFIDFSLTENPKEEVRTWIQMDLNTSLDIEKSELFKITLLKMQNNLYTFHVKVHHIIIDGWGMSMLVNRIIDKYNNIHHDNWELRDQYSYLDFINDDKLYVESNRYIKSKEFWIDYFKNKPEPIYSNGCFKRVGINELNGARNTLSIKADKYFDIIQQLSEHKLGFNDLVLLIVYLLFNRLTFNDEMIIGLPLLNRNGKKFKDTLGFFTDYLPVKFKINDGSTILESLKELKLSMSQGYRHQRFPIGDIEKIVNANGNDRLLDVIVSFAKYSSNDFLGTKSFVSSEVPDFQNNALILHVEEYSYSEHMDFHFDYKVAVFESYGIDRFIDNFKTLLDSITDLNLSINNVEMLSNNEKKMLLKDFNNTKGYFPKEKSVIDLFEDQVQENPDLTAIIFNNKKLSYDDLDKEADKVSFFLRKKYGVSRGDVVGVLLNRSEKILVAILGILKTGAAYVPIDPDYPQKRIDYMLKDCNPKVVISDKNEDCFVDISNILNKECCGSSFVREADPEDLIYTIYTSGTTGTPKGIKIPNRTVVNFIEGINNIYSFNSDTRIISVTTIGFDIFVLESLLPLTKGASIVMATEEEQIDPYLLSDVIIKNKVNLIQTTPSRINMLLMSSETSIALQQMDAVMIGGDIFPNELLKQLNKLKIKKILNMYGPAETTVWSTVKDLTNKKYVTIGKPILNTDIYILGKKQELLPIGVTGELCIAGQGVAHGYHNRAKLTNEKFVPNPFVQNSVMYRTGDQARWLNNGDIEFLGRVDNQVKIRGFRIEPGEIENIINCHSFIGSSVVSVVNGNNNNKELACYYVSDGELSVSNLRDFLKDFLPEYMIPSYFKRLDTLPLTPNGKIDRKSLPDVDIDLSSGSDYIPPETDLEKKITRIWEEILEITKVGIHDNFFDLGGHSIKAVRVASEIKNQLNHKVTLKDIFDNPTVKLLSLTIIGTEKVTFELQEIVKDNNKLYEPFPLTDVQQAYWIGRKDFYELGGVGTHGYKEFYFEELDIKKFEESINTLINRHEMLRVVVTNDGMQKLLKSVETFKLKILDLRGMNSKEEKTAFLNLRSEMSHQIFSGEKWPLFDIQVTIFRDGTYKVHFSVDFILMDGASSYIFLKELDLIYKDQIDKLPDLDITFRDYVIEENNLRSGSLYLEAKEYWHNRLEEMPLKPELILEKLPSEIRNPKFSRKSYLIEANTWKILEKKISRQRITPTTFFIQCFSEIISRWSKSNHFLLNLTLFNRLPLHKDIDKIIGDFTSLTLLEIDYRDNKSFNSRLKNTQKRLWEDIEHKIFTGIEVQRDLSRFHGEDITIPVVVTSMLGIGSDLDSTGAIVENEDDNIKKIYSISQTPQVWLDFQLYDTEDSVFLNWDYVGDLFPDNLINDMFDAFKRLINKLADSEHIWDSTIMNLTPESHLDIRDKINNTLGAKPKKCLHNYFVDSVKKYPENLAIGSKRRDLTYKELYTISHCLKDELLLAGAEKNKLVAVVMNKGWEQVAAVLGIQFSGAAYMPVDASYPQDRINSLLKIGEVKIVVTTSDVAERLKTYRDIKCICVDSFDSREYTKLKIEYHNIQELNDIAYVIFTSGSTGTPKGVVIDHRGASNTIIDINSRFGINSNDSCFALSSLSFDLSVYDIFGLLATGGSIIIPENEEAKDPVSWGYYFERYNITLWNSVPAFMQMLVEYADSDIKSLKNVLLSGDWIPVDLPDKIKESNKNINIYSLGGATEASIWSIYYPIGKVDRFWRSIPYGKPLLNQTFHVFDKNLLPSPEYVPGDLYIGGIGLAVEYWKDINKTDNSFIIHPQTGERLYKTGDLGRYLHDGNIEFLGRIDNQVKINGFRIEQGEIENTLLKHHDVDKVIITVIESCMGKKEIAAYYVSQKEIDTSILKEYLENLLPIYMIPTYFIYIDEIPLTSNGKVNKKALPKPESNQKLDISYSEPESEFEEIVLTVWYEILGLEKIGIDNNFFTMGGDSIKAIQLISKLKQIGYSSNIASLFRNPTVRSFAKTLNLDVSKTDQVLVTGDIPLTPIQKWFLEDYNTFVNHFNQAVMLDIKDFDFCKKSLLESIKSIINHHDALRISYPLKDNCITQFNRGHAEVYFKEYDVTDKEDISYYINKEQESFNLEEDTLIRFILFNNKDNYRLLIIAHHLVMDGVSWRILLEDLESCYSMVKSGNNVDLPLKTTSFMDWSKELNKYSQSDSINSVSNYWLRDELKELDLLPVSSANLNREKYRYTVKLNKKHTNSLLFKTAKAFNTKVDDLLIMSLVKAVSKWGGIENIGLELESHGRWEKFKDIDLTRSIGWFTSKYPVVFKSNEDIVSVKEKLRAVPDFGVEYGILKYIKRDQAINSVREPEILFNYLGQFDENDKGIFQIVPGEEGDSISREAVSLNKLSFTAMVISGELVITLETSYFSKEEIDQLQNIYLSEIIDCIDHCTNLKTSIKTPSDFTLNSLPLADYNRLLEDLDTDSSEIEDLYNLTALQEGLLFHSLVKSHKALYFEQTTMDFTGSIDVFHFEESWKKVINNHAVLRTLFTTKYEIPLQIVLKEREIDVSFVTLCESDNKISDIKKIQEDDKKRGFNLEKDPLFRVILIQKGNNEFTAIFSFHHIILDGWCLAKLFTEFKSIYSKSFTDESYNASNIPEYSSYINWLNGRDKNTSREYWKNYLSNYEDLSTIPTYKSEDKDLTVSDYQQYYQFFLDSDLSSNLLEKVKELGVTLNIFIQTVWGVLLSKYNNKSDNIFGSVVSGRPHELDQVEEMIGLFINTIPVRVNFENIKTFKELLYKMQKGAINSLDHHYYSLADIQSENNFTNSLLDHILIFDNYPIDQALGDNNQSDFSINKIDIFEQINYGFGIIITPGNNISFKIIYESAKYNIDYIKNIAGHIENTIRKVLSNININPGKINVISANEEDLILNKFNSTKSNFPESKTVVDLFEEQVLKTPNNIAVIYDDISLTYIEVNNFANSVADHLINNYYIKANDLVGIMQYRSEKMIITLLGILKAGAAYVPVDPEYPGDRIEYIIKDSKPKVIIGEYRIESNFKGMLFIEDILSSGPLTKNPEADLNPSDLAYVIYTSGSTGKPKGTLIEHRSLVNRIDWMQKSYPLSEADTILQKTTYTFDVSVWELFWWSLYGAKVCMLTPGGEKSPQIIIDTIQKYSVTAMHFVPSMYDAFLDYTDVKNLNKNIESLKYIFSSGEALTRKHVEDSSRIIKENNTKIINLYGPTEATIDVTYYNCEVGDKIIPIGKPISNITLYIVDKYNKLQPVGVPGELCISGIGLARGYLNKEKLTNEKFVDNPFVNGEKMYKTGDLTRWLPDGNIEFLGRIDNQVKIKGFRIELGEIEETLLSHNDIKSALVIAKEINSSKELVAYYTADKELELKIVKDYLGVALPSYMIPSIIVYLDKFPLLSNGKVDRKSLPDPDNGSLRSKDLYSSPENEVQRILLETWQDVLSCKEGVGIDHNYFDLGGDSIKSIQIMSRLNQKGLDGDVGLLFKYPTIREISQYISEYDSKVDQSDVTGDILFTPIQKWFTEKYNKYRNYFNQSVLLEFTNRIDEELLVESCHEVVRHHDALRITISSIGADLVQHNNDFSEIDITRYDLKNDNSADSKIVEIANSIHSSFNFSGASLIKFALISTKNKDMLLIIAHHMIIDGVSWRILLEDISAVYKGKQNNDIYKLPLKTTSFKEWSSFMYKYRLSESFRENVKFWESSLTQKFSNLPEVNKGLEDKKNENVLIIDIESTKELLTRCNEVYGTRIDELLLTSLALGISSWCGIERFLIDIESHGRVDKFENIDLSRTVGWFTSLYPIPIEDVKNANLDEAIIQVKESSRIVPDNGISYGIWKYLTDNQTNRNSFNSEILFNYLGHLDSDLYTDMFKVKLDSTGKNIDPNSKLSHKVVINSMIINKELKIVIESNYYNLTALEEIKSHLVESITRIKEYTLDKTLFLSELNESQNAELEGEVIYI